MPIRQKHYDSRGRYSGETLTQTAEEKAAEDRATAELGQQISTLLAVGVVLAVLYWIVKSIYGLLAEPASHDFPHNLFAYYYHYYFKLVFFVVKAIFSTGVFLYQIPAENFQFIKGITRFQNLNLILWLLALLAYIGVVGYTLLALLGAVANGLEDVWQGLAVLVAGLSFGPAVVWIGYAILEKIVLWIFR